MNNSTQTDSTDLDEPRRGITIGRAAAALVMGLLLFFWIWALAIADPDNPNELQTAGYAPAAQSICSSSLELINEVEPARDAKTPALRADQIEETTLLVEDMVAALKLEASTISISTDADLLELWFEDYDAYVSDRWIYVEKLRNAEPDASPRDLAFTLTERASGGVYTTRLDNFARVNSMSACQVPGDV